MDHGMAPYGECPGHSPGLRERKKAETREAIARAAVRLALEKGPENVRVADIAVAADVSPRTYNNYFASIPEAICALATDRVLRLADAVRGRPADEPLDEAVANAMLSVQDDESSARSLARMVVYDPVLRGEFFKSIMARDAALTRVIAERTGTSPDDLYPQVLTAAISGAIRVAGQRWLRDDHADQGELLRSALAMVAPMARAQNRSP
jgi:AcrR family transcriptional regulator